MYREQIKVLDCSIRDGGLINNHYIKDDKDKYADFYEKMRLPQE